MHLTVVHRQFNIFNSAPYYCVKRAVSLTYDMTDPSVETNSNIEWPFSQYVKYFVDSELYGGNCEVGY